MVIIADFRAIDRVFDSLVLLLLLILLHFLLKIFVLFIHFLKKHPLEYHNMPWNNFDTTAENGNRMPEEVLRCGVRVYRVFESFEDIVL